MMMRGRKYVQTDADRHRDIDRLHPFHFCHLPFPVLQLSLIPSSHFLFPVFFSSFSSFSSASSLLVIFHLFSALHILSLLSFTSFPLTFPLLSSISLFIFSSSNPNPISLFLHILTSFSSLLSYPLLFWPHFPSSYPLFSYHTPSIVSSISFPFSIFLSSLHRPPLPSLLPQHPFPFSHLHIISHPSPIRLQHPASSSVA